MDDLCFVEPVDRFGERVVIAISNTADRRHEAGLREPFRVLDRDILNATIRVVHEIAANRTTIMESLLQGIQNEARMRRS